MARFKVYYADGTVYTDEPKDAPGFGVIAILQESVHARFHVVSDAPYYMYLRGEWVGAKRNDIVDSLVNRLGEIEGFCVGQLVTRKEFNEIYQKVKVDRAKMD